MRLSQSKRDAISEQILSYLYSAFPEEPFTAQIAKEIVRDEEFIKKLLLELKEKGFILAIKKNKVGIPFTKRIRWRLTKKVYDIYHSKLTK